MKPLGDEVNKIIRGIFRKQNPILAELIVQWPKIVGAKFSTSSFPIKITRYTENRQKKSQLHIGCQNSALSMEMSFHQDIIIERIAVYLGYKAIHKVKIVVR